MGLMICIMQALSGSILIQSGYALPQESKSTGLETPNDIIKSNGYTIQHCSLLAPQVQKALESLYDVLPPAIWETHYGTASAPYQAFFKSSYYEVVVEGVLNSASIGSPIALDPAKEKELSVPTLVCALKPDTMVAHEEGQDHDIYGICKDNPTWTVMYYPGTSNIFICPIFFPMPTQPAAGYYPTVNETTNLFEGNFAAFWQSQIYMLLHEIAHFYIRATIEHSVNEIMDWNYAFSLSPANATFNALNYVLFVATVDKGCQDFPQSFEGRRLGQVLDLLNTTSGETRESQDLGPARGRVWPYHTDAMNATLALKRSTFMR